MGGKIFSVGNSSLLTGIFGGVDERELGRVARGQGKGEGSVFALLEGLRKVAHVVAGQVESGRNAGLPNVVLDVRLAVKVRDVGQAASRCFGDVKQRGEDEMLNADFFGGVGNVLALRDLDLVLAGLPVVGDEECSVAAAKHLRKGRL